jgi:hypothetical protein
VKSTTSRITVPPRPSGSKWCSWRQRRNGPSTCSSTKCSGGSKALIRDVIRQSRPKCLACQVTVSPSASPPEVTPSTARSPASAIDAVCTSTSSETSKTRRGGAAMLVVTSKCGTDRW